MQIKKGSGLQGFVVYQKAVSFATRVYALEISGNVRDHVIRSAESVVLNICEGHPCRGRERQRKYRIAAGEASEVKGALALLLIRGQLTQELHDDLFDEIDQICAMLYRLVRT